MICLSFSFFSGIENKFLSGLRGVLDTEEVSFSQWDLGFALASLQWEPYMRSGDWLLFSFPSGTWGGCITSFVRAVWTIVYGGVLVDSGTGGKERV